MELGILKAFNETLKGSNPAMLEVTLEGLENILNCGEKNYSKDGNNLFALEFEREGGLDSLEYL